MKAALDRVRDSKSRTLGEYYRFISDPHYERYDASKIATWVVTEIQDFDDKKDALPPPILRGSKNKILRAHIDSEDRVDIQGYELEKLSEGKIRLRKTTP
jgi:hypothetical protein